MMIYQGGEDRLKELGFKEDRRGHWAYEDFDVKIVVDYPSGFVSVTHPRQKGNAEKTLAILFEILAIQREAKDEGE